MLFISCYHDSQLHAVDVATGSSHIAPRRSSPKSVEVSRDGRYVWSADYGPETNSVSVVDTQDWTARVFRVPGMDRGSGITLFPDGKRARHWLVGLARVPRGLLRARAAIRRPR